MSTSGRPKKMAPAARARRLAPPVRRARTRQESVAGRMFWFERNRFSGSYFALMWASLA
jgi:hypothetical protein